MPERSAWKEVYSNARKAALAKVGERGEAKSYAEDITKAQKDSLASLLAAYVEGRIDRETFDGEIADARRALRSELAATRGISAKQAQAATRAFFAEIDAALDTGIKGL